MTQILAEQQQAFIFVSNTLAPFFLRDPQQHYEQVASLYEAIAEVDPQGAADEWPFIGCDAPSQSREQVCAALEMMKCGVRSAQESSTDPIKTPLESLTWEYRRLFVGPGPKAAPLWGSVYTDRESVVFGASTLELRQWMRKVGIVYAEDTREPEDHIGLLLSLMGWIAQNKPEELGDFLTLHLLTWAPHFLELMERETNQEFFKGLALLTRETLLGIQHELDLKPEIPRFYR